MHDSQFIIHNVIQFTIHSSQLLGSSYRVKKMGFFTGVQNDTSIDYTDLNNAQFTVHNAQLLGSSYRVLKEEILR
jgi:hypothetical protein